VEDKTGAGATFCGAVIFKAGLMDLLTDVDGEEHADTAGLATVVLTGTVLAAAGLAAMGADATGAGTTLSGLGVSFLTFFAAAVFFLTTALRTVLVRLTALGPPTEALRFVAAPVAGANGA
jgi:hypothetical protein